MLNTPHASSRRALIALAMGVLLAAALLIGSSSARAFTHPRAVPSRVDAKSKLHRTRSGRKGGHRHKASKHRGAASTVKSTTHKRRRPVGGTTTSTTPTTTAPKTATTPTKPSTTTTTPATTTPATTTPATTTTPPTTTTPSAPTTTTPAPPTVTVPVPGTDPLSMIGVTATTQSASNPSGVAMPSGDLPGWKQVYSDDFSTSVPLGGFSGCIDGQTIMSSTCTGLPSSVASQLWAYPDGWSDTSGNGQYTPSQVLSIHNNMLDYYLHTSGSTHMVAAVVPKIPDGVSGNGLQYGAYAIRFKSDLIAGYKTAFLLWPDSGIWPADGEIDFPEGNLNGTIGAYMHQMNATSGSQQNAYSTNTTYSSWHTAVIEWTPTTCRFILDGQIIGTSVSLIPNTPMHWVLQAETALSGGAPASSVSGHIYIAWITAYAQDTGL